MNDKYFCEICEAFLKISYYIARARGEEETRKLILTEKQKMILKQGLENFLQKIDTSTIIEEESTDT